MPRKSIFIIVSNINKALAFEWTAELLDKKRFAVSFILLNPGDSELEQYCRENAVPVKRITYRSKKDLPKAFLVLFFHFLVKRPHAIHCHLFDAYMTGLAAAWLAFIPKRIYTRHNATYHREYYPNMVKFDKLAGKLATHIVAIDENVKQVLRQTDNVPERKIRTIHHGFKLDRFANVPEAEVAALAEKYGTNGKHPVVGLITRYLDLKGIQYVIPAWKKLREEFPNTHLILANARGPYANEVKKLLENVPPSAYTEIPFENNIYALHKLFDIHVHAPINAEIEAYGQTYIEALAAGTPSVFTLSGVAPEFIRHEQNALVVPFQASEPIYEAMKRILTDNQLRNTLVITGKADVQQFAVETMIRKLEGLYDEKKRYWVLGIG